MNNRQTILLPIAQIKIEHFELIDRLFRGLVFFIIVSDEHVKW